jgi:hypothetical protein
MDQVNRIREIGQKNLNTLRVRGEQTLQGVESLARTTTEKAREQLAHFQGEGQANLSSIREKGQKNLATIREKGQKTLQDVETIAKAKAAQVSAGTQKVVKNVHDQLTKDHLDDLLGKLSVKDLIEKLRAGELLEHGVTLRNELFEKLGVVLREDFEAALRRIDALEAKVKDVAKKAAAAKKATPAA